MCLQLLEEANRVCAALGEDDSACRRARWLYSACETARAGRMSDTRADDRLMALFAMLAAADEALFGKLKRPPVPCGLASAKAREQIFADKDKAMIFSNKIAEAFSEAGIKLAEDQTYACTVCVVEKPRVVSEALAVDPLGIKTDRGPLVNYVMEPAVMKAVMRQVEKETINYT